MIEVGRKVFLKAVGNSARGSKEPKIKESYIVKVGRKFFYVSESMDDLEYRWIPFHIEGLRQKTDHSASWSLYFDKQQIFDEIERINLQLELRLAFDAWNQKRLTLDQLRRIKAIIEEGEREN